MIAQLAHQRAGIDFRAMRHKTATAVIRERHSHILQTDIGRTHFAVIYPVQESGIRHFALVFARAEAVNFADQKQEQQNQSAPDHQRFFHIVQLLFLLLAMPAETACQNIGFLTSCPRRLRLAREHLGKVIFQGFKQCIKTRTMKNFR